MTEFGLMAVDWEERVNFERMRRYRLERAKRALNESDADVLLVMRAEDIRYLTGSRHHMGPVTRFGGEMAVLPKGGDPILYGMDWAHQQARMPWMPKEYVREAVDWRAFLGLKAWAEDLQRTIGDLRGKRIGVDQLTITMLHRLQEILPHSELVDGWTILGKAKQVKSEDEIECLKAATMITEAGFDACLRVLGPGVRECEVLAEAWKVMTALGSEWTQCANIVVSGPYTYPLRRFTSDRIIRAGDLVIIDIGGCFNGYWGDFTRTWVCGDMLPTRRQKELHQALYNAAFDACAACRPGNTNADVVNAVLSTQPNIMYAMGHAEGINPWELPTLTKDSRLSPTPLEVGMVLCVEPFMGEPGTGGVKTENNVVVRDAGPEVFSTYPHDERLLDEVHPLDTTTGRTRRPTRQA